MLRKKLAFSLVAMLACVLMASPVKSQTREGLEISPVSYDLEIKRGSSQSANFVVKNNDATPIEYELEIELFKTINEDGAPVLEGVKQTDGVSTLVDWIKFSSPSTGTIDAKGSLNTSFTVTVPENAEPGGHYAAVFAKQTGKSQAGDTKLGVSSRVGMIILVSVAGEVRQTGEISSFTYPKFLWRGPVDFNLKFKNTGTVHYDSEAKVEIQPLIGKIREADLSSHTLLPNSTRSFSGSWNNQYPIGYYRLTAVATDGNGSPVTVIGSFWAIPLIMVIPVILLALLIWGIAIYVKQNYQVVKK